MGCPGRKAVKRLCVCVCVCVCVWYRHAGDLGNVEAVNGVVNTSVTDWLVTLFGPQSMIGKVIVVSTEMDMHWVHPSVGLGWVE